MSCRDCIRASRKRSALEWLDLQTARALGPGNKSRDDGLCVARASLSCTRCVNPVGARPRAARRAPTSTNFHFLPQSREEIGGFPAFRRRQRLQIPTSCSEMFGNENFPLPARADLPYGWKLGTTRKPGGDWGGRLSDMAEVLDLVVVGGGINGAGIARDAAGRGLSVLLCEKSDLDSATSSASTKLRSEEHTSELQSLMRISYAVLCLKKKIHY